MADLSSSITPAARLLTILDEGRITQEEYDSISPTMNVNTRPATLGSSVIIGLPPMSELEAVSRVLNTAELLESILSHLPALLLISVAPRVCKGFHRAIEASPTLQRKTFRKLDHGMRKPTLLFEAGSTEARSWLTEAQLFSTTFIGETTDFMILDFTPQALLDAVRHCPTLGRTLLMQPPVQYGSLRLGTEDGNWAASELMERRAGVTIGDLITTIIDVKAKMDGVPGNKGEVMVILEGPSRGL
ncbi:hypothetical protein LTR85_008482 [Meristemomyces frigidus]|nr:hypothetical protein LTR85_008482 [Meristemomyces frigidus]